MALSLDETNLISTVLQSMLYGIAMLMYSTTVWLLLQKKGVKRSQYYIVCAATFLILLATAEMIIDIVRLTQSLVTIGPHLPGKSVQYLSGVTGSRLWVAKSCLYNLQTLILDAVLVYRVFVVWQSFYMTIIPLICWVGLLASSIGVNIVLAITPPDLDEIGFSPFAIIGQWVQAFYGLAIGSNFIPTALLAYRIWKIDRQTSYYRTGGILKPFLTTLVESGAIYSIILAIGLITSIVHSVTVFIVLDTISPIISIVFNLIIIRIGRFSLVSSVSPDLSTTTGMGIRKHHGSAHRGNNGHIFSHGTNLGDPTELKTLEIQVTSERVNDLGQDVMFKKESGSPDSVEGSSRWI